MIVMANAGMDIKDLQYLMGQADAEVTLNVYTHASYAHAESAMQKILQFQPDSSAEYYTNSAPIGGTVTERYGDL